MPKRRGKQIANATLLGQQGVNLVESIVHDLGCVWYPTSGVEAGIDGHIELRDQATGEVLNSFIGVQSKATSSFANESSDEFDFYVDERDLDYWLRGNLPVILVVSRPSRREAYWVAIKDYFSDPSKRKAHKVHFNKSRNRFDASSRNDLFNLGLSRAAGVYLAPPHKEEDLISNLMEVVLPDRIYVADTHFRDPADIWAHARDSRLRIGREWLLHSKKVWSFADLTRREWSSICDRGTVEDFVVSEWAYSDDDDRRRTFVNLLRRTLRAMVSQDLEYHERLGIFFFRPTGDLSSRILEYKSLVNNAERVVFRPYTSSDGQIKYYRHSAFEDRFYLFDGRWYLAVTPTYYFTRDGFRRSGNSSGLLKGIKEIEGHEAVRGQVVMWSEFLTPRGDMFSSEPYPFLGLKKLYVAKASRGILDDEWRLQAGEDAAPSDTLDLNEAELPPLLKLVR